ncbi:hypothetical protein AAF712_015301 [Marasmius tenuissimus]|uniref:Uncharacterized protein n=1 Tax=Marasmius tenuissimus TaxID=585030 RepID=A0ABR2ZAQ6_9AGAR
MENIASVSRSSGLEKDGDALKNHKTQEEYRQFIQDKVDIQGLIIIGNTYSVTPISLTISGDNSLAKSQQTNSESKDEPSFRRISSSYSVGNVFRSWLWVLILDTGKLREGLVSSKRYDSFSLEVYETSLYLSALFRNTKQSSSIIPYLLPELYEKIPGPHDNLLSTILISLAHELLVAYPSIGKFQHTLNAAVRGAHLQKASPAYTWITHLSSSVRSNNYCKFEELTRRESIISVLQNGIEPSPTRSTHNPVQKAMFSLVDQLRSRCRDRTWTTLRSAYRELACHEESGTRGWLVRSLALQTTVTSKDEEFGSDLLDKWLEEKSTSGHVQRKEGVQNRWLVAKVR